VLDNIIQYSIKNKLIIGLLTLLLILWGVWSATKLPIDALPDITDNQVQIITQAPTLATQEVEQYVTSPIEKALANLPKIVEMRSFSRFGLSVITVVFKDDMDIYFARQLINEKLKNAEKEIPAEMGKPELAPVTTGLGEIYQYVIHPVKGKEQAYTAMDLRTMQDWIVSRQLTGIAGVAEVTGFGGITKQYEVAVNPDRLKALGISIPEIFNALKNNNENTGGAYIDKKPNAYFIRGIGVVKNFEDIENIVVKIQANGTPILIRDVANVKFGNAPRFGALTYNGEKEVVGGIVMMLKGANSSEVVKAVKQRMETVQKSLPNDVLIEPFLDRTNLVKRAIGTVEKNLIEGALIVIFVLIVFLGNLRAGLIVASAIPLALLFALGCMNLFGVSANLMSLGAIDFGLIVDGAVIIVEATLHHLGLRKSIQQLTQAEMDTEVYTSASKIRSSAAFGEIIILIVYIPILSLIGIEGKMFGPMAQTVGFAIFGALLLSLTYIPMMCALFLSKKINNTQNFSDKMMHYLQSKYEPLLKKAILFKNVIVWSVLVLSILSFIIFKNMGGEFIPTLEEGDYAIEFTLPQGASLSQTIETITQAENILKLFPEVKMVVGKTGAADVATDPMPMEASDIMVILKDKKEWKSGLDFYELAAAMKTKLQLLPGVIAEPSQPIQMRFNELMTGIKQDVAIKIFGENLDTLAKYALLVDKAIQKVDGISAPQIERISGLPQISINYDHTKMAVYGLNVSEVNQVITTAFAGQKAGQVYEDERKFDLVIRLDGAYRSNLEDVRNLFIPTSNGNQIPLSQVADIDYKLGPAQISREDGKRRVYVSFNVNGKDVQTVVNNIQEILAQKIKLPTGYYFTYGGAFENLQQASKRLMIAVPISLLLIFLLLYFTFGTLKQAALIFTAIPMSAIGGVLALLICGMPFSISAGIGFIALFGVAVLNGIVLVGTFNQLEKEGWLDVVARVIEGTKIRLRPVLMTATVASLGFLPMALSNSAGAEVQKPLATVVIGGLLTATFLTLFVLPLLYILFNSKTFFSLNKFSKATLILIGLFVNINVTDAQTLQINNADEAIAIALGNNKTILASSYKLQAKEQLIKTSYELPKLDFNFGLGQFNSAQVDNNVQVSQAIPWPTIFAAKRQLFKAHAAAQNIAHQLSISDVKKQIRLCYYQIQYLQHNQQQLQLLDSIYAEAVRVAQLRFKTGDIKKIEINTAEVKQGEIQLLQQQNDIYIKNAIRDLGYLINTHQNIIVPIVNKYEPLQYNTLIADVVIKNNLQIQALQQEATILQAAKKIHIADALPELKLGYYNQSIIGSQIVNNNTVNYNNNNRFQAVNIGLAIPLNRQANKAKKYAIALEQQSVMAKQEDLQLQLNMQLQNAMQQYQQDVAQYNYYHTQAKPNATAILKAAQLGYTAGEINYVEYLYAIQIASDIELKYLQAIQQVNETVLGIQQLINQ
jgi:heavy metal efflux system protein